MKSPVLTDNCLRKVMKSYSAEHFPINFICAGSLIPLRDIYGAYLLVLSSSSPATIHTRSKTFFIDEGYYIYIGSACGSGGLASRVGRHLRREKRMHWHIDFLLSMSEASVIYVLLIATHKRHYCNKSLESKLSLTFKKNRLFTSIEGFGASDLKPNVTTNLYKYVGRSKDILLREILAIAYRLAPPSFQVLAICFPYS